jgi:hypothetical protein
MPQPNVTLLSTNMREAFVLAFCSTKTGALDGLVMRSYNKGVGLIRRRKMWRVIRGNR